MRSGMATKHCTLDDIEAELRDPASRGGRSTEAGIPCPNPIRTIGVRLELDDARLIGDAARKANLPINRYLLQVAPRQRTAIPVIRRWSRTEPDQRGFNPHPPREAGATCRLCR